MKLYTAFSLNIIVVLFLITQNLNAQPWSDADFSDDLSEVKDLHFTSGEVGYMIGSTLDPPTTRIFKTTNGGSWGQPVLVDNTAKDIHFFSPQNGITSGGSLGTSVCRTSNAGASWECESIGFSCLGEQMYYLDNSVGFIFGPGVSPGDDVILKTTDGGASWGNVTPPNPPEAIYGVHFISSSVGFAAGGNALLENGVVFKTTDGGNTWTEIFANEDYTFWDVNFTSSTRGFLVGNGANGNGGKMFETSNGGDSWTIVNNIPDMSSYRDIYFSDGISGIASGNSGSFFGGGVVLKTTDGGDNWEQVHSTTMPGFLPLTKIHHNLFNGKIYVASPGGGYVQSTLVTSTTEVTLSEIGVSFFPNPTMGVLNFDNTTNTVKKLHVLDLTGKMVAQRTISPGESMVDFSFLDNGVYYLRTISNNKSAIEKFVKIK